MFVSANFHINNSHFHIMEISDSNRIKSFLKKGIQARIISAKQLMMLKPEHLKDVKELEGIEQKTIVSTLKQIQAQMQSRSRLETKDDIDEDSITQLIEEKAGSYLEDVKKIYSTF